MEYYVDEIKDALKAATNIKLNPLEDEELENVLFNLKAIAENPYNRDGYRILWKIFQTIVDDVYTNIIW